MVGSPPLPANGRSFSIPSRRISRAVRILSGGPARRGQMWRVTDFGIPILTINQKWFDVIWLTHIYIYIYLFIYLYIHYFNVGLIAINLIAGGYLVLNVKFIDHVARSIGLSPRPECGSVWRTAIQRTSKKKPVAETLQVTSHGAYQNLIHLFS